MCQGQVRINSKKLPLDTRTYHPIFLKMRVFLPNHITGNGICHFTRIAAISWLRQKENNLQEGACSFDTRSGQIRHQSLTFPASAFSGCCSNHNVLSCASWPCVPLPIAGCHWGENSQLPQWVCAGPLQGRSFLGALFLIQGSKHFSLWQPLITPVTWCLASEMLTKPGSQALFPLLTALPWNNRSGMAGKGRGNNNPSPPSFDGTPAVRMSISFPAGNHRALKAFGPVFHCKQNLCKAFPELPEPEGRLDGSLRGCREKHNRRSQGEHQTCWKPGPGKWLPRNWERGSDSGPMLRAANWPKGMNKLWSKTLNTRNYAFE